MMITGCLNISFISVLFVLALHFDGIDGFLELRVNRMTQSKLDTLMKSSSFSNDSNNDDNSPYEYPGRKVNDNNKSCRESGRRNFLGSGIMVVSGMLLGNVPAANARDELFKTNPLTNQFLEQIRILEQAEADNIKYGGELAAGDSGNKGKVEAYPKLLIPILVMDQELSEIKSLVVPSSNNDSSSSSSSSTSVAITEFTKDGWSKALEIIQQEKYEKVNFKKTFNAYGDNIYYSDPDRANLYLGGGATPKTEQSIAYLLRNDILTNVEALRAELEYRIKSNDSDDIEDLYQYATIASSAMKKYLAIVPKNELDAAQSAMMK